MKYSSIYWGDVAKAAYGIPQVSKLFHKSLLITGGTGMICSTVAELLFYLNKERDADIKILLAGRSLERTKGRFNAFEEGTDYFFVPYDATKDEPLTITADYIIHGASNASPAVFRSEPVETMLSNLLGLKCLLDMAVKARAKRLLYISSSEVYGRNENNQPYSEDNYGYVDILNPRAAYPSSKRAAETLCAAYGAEYGVDTVIVRPGHIYGPTITDSDDRASAQFTRAAARGEPIVMKSAGTQLRSYCHTLDCASAILTVLLMGEKGQAYNISNQNSIASIRDVAETLAREAGTSIVFIDPTDAEKKGYNLMENSVLVSEKVEKLGWRGMFNLERGIEETLKTLKG